MVQVQQQCVLHIGPGPGICLHLMIVVQLCYNNLISSQEIQNTVTSNVKAFTLLDNGSDLLYIKWGN